MKNGKTNEPAKGIGAQEALQRLKDGNRRFTKNLTSLSTLNHSDRREKSVQAQHPFAIVLSCSDSRVPSEYVFDQGLGDLFVIRVAGNIVAPSIVGSVEFAASTFGTQLVVVMGHSNCGAVSAALNVARFGNNVASDNIRDIVDRINPAIQAIVDLNSQYQHPKSDQDLLEQCIKSNVFASVSHLTHSSKIIEELVKNKRLMVVGAEYSLDSGKVTFYEDISLREWPLESTPVHTPLRSKTMEIVENV